MSHEPEEILKLARAAVKACTAESSEVFVTAQNLGQIRWAAGGVTTSGATDRVSVSVRASFGNRSASAESEDVTPEGIARVARTATDLARLTPPSPEFMGPVKPQVYPKTFAWDAPSAMSSPEARAAKAAAALAVAKNAGLVGAGYLEDSATVVAFANSAGASGTWRGTSSDFSTTLRTPDGKQSGWAGLTAVKSSDIDADALAKRAAQKAVAWRDPIELPPGRYTAVLEPAAVAPLAEWLVGALDRRSADEGTSCFSRAGGTRIGETLFSESLSVVSDPADKKIPGHPWGDSGLAAQKLVAVDHGKLAALDVGRFWAKQKKLAGTPNAGNWSFVFDKPAKDLDELLAGVEKGVLVTRIWYVRMLAPQTLTVTGLTRDATFLIEDGKVTSPIKNFRLNQSVLDMLKNVDAAGPVQMVSSSAGDYGGALGVPAMRVKDFGFSSISEAV
ncbi:MAG TPA: TldD/PmbA family protein [bacterium]|nr:TldD/PmbA family protein [bacterium]